MAHGTVGSSPAPVVVPLRKSPYERLKHDLERDSRVAQELAQGKRVGFYKLKGQLGSGNFSRVKLAYHLLSNGRLFVVYNLVQYCPAALLFMQTDCMTTVHVRLKTISVSYTAIVVREVAPPTCKRDLAMCYSR